MRLNITANYAVRMVCVLGDGKMRTLGEISLYNVCRVTEMSMKVSRCLEDETCCSRNQDGDCPVQRYFRHLQSTLEKELSVSLEDICAGRFCV